MNGNPSGLENFRILIDGSGDNLHVESLFIEFKWLVSKSGKLFDFDIGPSYCNDEEGLELSMTANRPDGRYLLLTTNNHGELCIDARRQQMDADGNWTGSEIEMVAKLPDFDVLTEKVSDLVLDFINEDYGALYKGWYMEK